MEELCRHICHVTIEENKQGLNDTDVGGEAGSEGCGNPIYNSNKYPSQGNNKETQEPQSYITECDLIQSRILFKKVI